ncbi:MAG: GNAT family N-acetyltransferase [Candidatus Njordarchaeales archaeon]
MGEIYRLARDTDREFVISFTRNTWEWGDYIPQVWNDWLRDPRGRLYVAEVDGKPVAILHAAFLLDNSVWLEGLRVHPEYRRRGIAYRLNKYVIENLINEGYRVFRMAIMHWNTPSINLAKKLGFYEVDTWLSLETKIGNLLAPQLETICFLIEDIEEVWNLIQRTDVYSLSQGLLCLDWKWIKFDKEILKQLLRERKLEIISCRENILGITTPGKTRYKAITLLKAQNLEDLQVIANYLHFVKKLEKRTTIEFVFPEKLRPLATLPKQTIFEQDKIIVMELKV